jgi:hypothetical protein
VLNAKIVNVGCQCFSVKPSEYCEVQLWWGLRWSTNEVLKEENKKSDAQVGRVNIFHTLQTMHKGPLNFKLCMKRPLRFSNF